jgi:hypothetical protein
MYGRFLPLVRDVGFEKMAGGGRHGSCKMHLDRLGKEVAGYTRRRREGVQTVKETGSRKAEEEKKKRKTH